MEDNQIIELIRQENENGLLELQKKYNSYIEYIIRGVLSKYPEDMEECLNDINLKIWNGLKNFDENKSSLKTFISYVARNSAIDKIRKINRESLHIDKNVDVIYDSYEGKGSYKSAEEEVFLQENKIKLLNAIEKLGRTDREIFYRKYYYLQSVSQIAAEMNRSEKSIEGKLSRIRKRLKNLHNSNSSMV